MLYEKFASTNFHKSLKESTSTKGTVFILKPYFKLSKQKIKICLSIFSKMKNILFILQKFLHLKYLLFINYFILVCFSCSRKGIGFNFKLRIQQREIQNAEKG